MNYIIVKGKRIVVGTHKMCGICGTPNPKGQSCGCYDYSNTR